MKNKGATTAAIAVALLGVSACSMWDTEPWEETDLDEEAWNACIDNAKHYNESGYEPSVKVARVIKKEADSSDVTRIQDAADMIASAADGDRGLWKVGSNLLTRACHEMGWDGGEVVD